MKCNNVLISSTYSGWIDLFGWGTSGWNNGNIYYQPWDSDDSNASLYGPLGDNSLTDNYANSDWGHYNAISNGGNSTGQWRTLTQNEWDYVYNIRNTSSGIYFAKARVNNVNGTILLPDNWNTSVYNLSNVNESEAEYYSNVISATAWANTLELNGAIFLPVAGLRQGTQFYNSSDYWSASYYHTSSYYGWYAYVMSTYYNSHAQGRSIGHSVRLVQDY